MYAVFISQAQAQFLNAQNKFPELLALPKNNMSPGLDGLPNKYINIFQYILAPFLC